ncbi:phosphate acetyltransferase [candidate division KSB1 bacterium]|nr:phosphate acetyltransferase [candidate division KSB1 bacterium]MBL7093575.1 phosphate acetyltransferase [candidate division KSB1 bacterium]
MELIQQFIEKAKQQPRKIVYPESTDERILIAASKIKEMGIAEPILVGDEEKISALAKECGAELKGIQIVNPVQEQEKLESYAEEYATARDVKISLAQRLVKKSMSFAGMMVKMGDADGMVAGVATATASVIQFASLTIGFQEGMSTPSSFFIMVLPEFEGEKDKIFIFADCAVNVSPDPRQLAEIGVASGLNAKSLLGIEPKIAFLSFATKGSANHKDVDKVNAAVEIAKELKPELAIDGELQADAAIIQRVAEKKVKQSEVAGGANVLVFPDLDAGNISYKLVQYLAGAKAYGPILQGFAKPVNDMSRGATIDDLIGVTAITVVQAG